MNIISETIYILGNSLGAFKHRVKMCKSVFYRLRYEYHQYNNCDYSDVG